MGFSFNIPSRVIYLRRWLYPRSPAIWLLLRHVTAAERGLLIYEGARRINATESGARLKVGVRRAAYFFSKQFFRPFYLARIHLRDY